MASTIDEGGASEASGRPVRRHRRAAPATPLQVLRRRADSVVRHLADAFVAHPRNGRLRAGLSDGQLDVRTLYSELVALLHRLVLQQVAEARSLLPDPGVPQGAQALYWARHSLSAHARAPGPGADSAPAPPPIAGSAPPPPPSADLPAAAFTEGGHAGSWEGLLRTLHAVLRGQPDEGLVGFGSSLSEQRRLALLSTCALDDADVRGGLRLLLGTPTSERLDFSALGAPELGGLHVALLEGQPAVANPSGGPPQLDFSAGPGRSRKTQGAYYTPPSLVDALLDSTLEPAVDAALAELPSAAEAERALLDLKVCDPACGAGHFLLAAARRMAERLVELRRTNGVPDVRARRAALRDVLTHCIYGVDLDPLAVDICRLGLQLEASAPGEVLPAAALNIHHGDALLGATPEVLRQGVPDAAFSPLVGDDRARASELRRRNQRQRRGQTSLFGGPEVQQEPEITASDRDWADAWCGAFFWPAREPEAADAPTHDVLRCLAAGQGPLPARTLRGVRQLAREHRFFHWHLALPEVFAPRTGRAAGFDVVLVNPPWERLKFQEKEWLATRRPDLASATSAASRRRGLEQACSSDPRLHAELLAHRRRTEGRLLFLRCSGRYPLCGQGDINAFAVFAELAGALLAPRGRAGCVVPTSIATGATTRHFFQHLMEERRLVSLYDFRNRRRLFRQVSTLQTFALLTTAGQAQASAPRFAFGLQDPVQLAEPGRVVRLTAAQVQQINPSSGTCPVFRSEADARLARGVHERLPLLRPGTVATPGGWQVRLLRMLDITADAAHLRTRPADGSTPRGCLPVYEGKMVGMFDHRAASVEFRPQNKLRQQQALHHSDEQHADPCMQPQAYHYAAEDLVFRRLPAYWNREWFATCKRVTSAANERTAVGCVLPWSVVSYTLYVVLVPEEQVPLLPALLGTLCSHTVDYLVRQKTTQPSLPMGVVYETPFPTPATYRAPAPWAPQQSVARWMLSRVLELSYTAWDLSTFASDFGWRQGPFRWDPTRRFQLRCELDAAAACLYGLQRGELEHVLSTFPVLRRRDERRHGSYRTATRVLEVFDALQAASAGGVPYTSPLQPPPADPGAALSDERPRVCEPGFGLPPRTPPSGAGSDTP